MIGNRKYPYKANPNFIRDLRLQRFPADVRDMFVMLGIDGNKLPDEGIAPQVIQGIKVWVTPKVDKPRFIRTMAQCPVCHREMAVSRLQQHKCKVQS